MPKPLQTSARNNNVAPLARREGWDLRLLEYLQAEAAEPSAWGVRDCCTFTADCLQRLAGVDLAQLEGLRGKYQSAQGAYSLLKRNYRGGVEEMAAALAEKYGLPEIPPPFAGRGDPVLFDAPEGPTLGLVDFDGRSILARNPAGLTRYPVAIARRAWRIP
jgi:hypothetical protein